MKRILAALGLALAIAAPLPASASLTQLSNLFVFGDSLSDGGNSGLLTKNTPGGVFPPLPYFNGQYSNGPVAVQYLWDLYNPGNPGGFKPSLDGGTNYAIGGSTTGVENYNALTQPVFDGYGAANQLQQFLGAGGTFNPATSLFVVWLFPNDVFYYLATNTVPTPIPGSPGGDNPVTNGIANIVTLIQDLAGLGAQNFLVPNMPDLGITPEFSGGPLASEATEITNLFNGGLKLALDALDASSSIKITQFNTQQALYEIVGNPSAFGFTNVKDSCVANLATDVCDPKSWVFWDGVHPTTYTHSILGAEFRAAVPEPGTISLIALALSMLLLKNAVRRPRA
jgi:phospholipase/lecithinase/hemolysin